MLPRPSRQATGRERRRGSESESRTWAGKRAFVKKKPATESWSAFGVFRGPAALRAKRSAKPKARVRKEELPWELQSQDGLGDLGDLQTEADSSDVMSEAGRVKRRFGRSRAVGHLDTA